MSWKNHEQKRPHRESFSNWSDVVHRKWAISTICRSAVVGYRNPGARGKTSFCQPAAAVKWTTQEQNRGRACWKEPSNIKENRNQRQSDCRDSVVAAAAAEKCFGTLWPVWWQRNSSEDMGLMGLGEIAQSKCYFCGWWKNEQLKDGKYFSTAKEWVLIVTLVAVVGIHKGVVVLLWILFDANWKWFKLVVQITLTDSSLELVQFNSHSSFKPHLIHLLCTDSDGAP